MLVLIPFFVLLSSLLSSIAHREHREPRAYHHHQFVRQTSVVYVRHHPVFVRQTPVIYQRPAFVRPAPYTTAIYYYR
ncbi:MAG: hypothetical protein U0269_06325 [Polyangiales bacterium]